MSSLTVIIIAAALVSAAALAAGMALRQASKLERAAIVRRLALLEAHAEKLQASCDRSDSHWNNERRRRAEMQQEYRAAVRACQAEIQALRADLADGKPFIGARSVDEGLALVRAQEAADR